MKKILLPVLVFLAAACSPKEEKKEAQEDTSKTTENTAIVMDPHSYSKPNEAYIKHLSLDIAVDFDQKSIAGTASFDIANPSQGTSIVFDCKDMDISKVMVDGQEAKFEVGEEKPWLGKPLTVTIAAGSQKVAIAYKTQPQAGALQWLPAQQTAGKKRPFMFTQSQAILARTWVPCQDSPGIRFTYDAKVTVPKDLLALMSASNAQEKNAEGIYNFEMKQPIPSYLLALCVGDIAFKAIGEKTGVYAEPSMLEKSANEFVEVDSMLAAAESLYGTYAWDRYDLLVLPPSFPFGGMENPRLTFATPTILAGDRSLVSLVAHELAHSWSGNLVTNAVWDDFWLNEGFTVYFETRIMEAVSGKEYADMLALLSYQDLMATIEEMNAAGNSKDTKLKLALAGRDPDDGLTAIAYDKGFFLLRTMEEAVGREKWDEFLKNYFAANAFKTITTERFLVYLKENLFDKNPGSAEKVNIDAWVYGEGLPANCPKITSARFEQTEKTLAEFNAGKAPKDLDTKGWKYQQWLHFLRSLPATTDAAVLKKLDAQFAFTASGNNEILGEWLKRVVATEYKPGYAKLEAFLMSVGRRKFINPIYQEMLKKESTAKMAKDIYAKARGNYHYVAVSTLDKLLEVTK